MIVTVVTRKKGGNAVYKAIHIDDIEYYIFQEARRGRYFVRIYRV